MPEQEELGIKLLLLSASVPELHINYREAMQCLQSADLLILAEGKSLNVCTFHSITGITIPVVPLISRIIKLLELMILFSCKKWETDQQDFGFEMQNYIFKGADIFANMLAQKVLLHNRNIVLH